MQVLLHNAVHTFNISYTCLGGLQDSPHLKQWWIQEFQNKGRGPGAVEFLESGDCFDAPSHICR